MPEYIPLASSDLKAYVGAQAVDDAYLESCWAQSVAMVDGFCVDAAGEPIDVPVAIVDRAKLEVGSELFHRRSSPQGVSQFATPDGNPIRIARDPMVAAYPLLKPYVLGIGGKTNVAH